MTAAVNAPVRRKPGPKPGTQAKNNPVHSPARELHTDDIPQMQPPPVSLALGKELQRGESIEVLDKPLTDEYTQALQFAEEPVTIRIEPGQEKNAPTVIDCWVNGKGAEVLDSVTGKWMEINCLPIGGEIVTKRKYVEVLARAKYDSINTVAGSTRDENPENRIQRSTSRRATFSVLRDDNPLGREWLNRLMRER